MTHILLTPEDVIQEGDEFWSGAWLPGYGGDFGQHPIPLLIWRRPIVPPCWIEVKSGVLPKPGECFWVWSPVGPYTQFVDSRKDIVIDLWFKARPSLTHWMPMAPPYAIPDPPKAEPSEAESAWEEYLKTGPRRLTRTEQAGFLAGFHAGKEKGK